MQETFEDDGVRMIDPVHGSGKGPRGRQVGNKGKSSKDHIHGDKYDSDLPGRIRYIIYLRPWILRKNGERTPRNSQDVRNFRAWLDSKNAVYRCVQRISACEGATNSDDLPTTGDVWQVDLIPHRMVTVIGGFNDDGEWKKPHYAVSHYHEPLEMRIPTQGQGGADATSTDRPAFKKMRRERVEKAMEWVSADQRARDEAEREVLAAFEAGSEFVGPPCPVPAAPPTTPPEVARMEKLMIRRPELDVRSLDKRGREKVSDMIEGETEKSIKGVRDPKEQSAIRERIQERIVSERIATDMAPIRKRRPRF